MDGNTLHHNFTSNANKLTKSLSEPSSFVSFGFGSWRQLHISHNTTRVVSEPSMHTRHDTTE